jgi:hypothetical protein
MYDAPEVDERYTDQARILVKVIGDDRLAPPVEEWFVTVDTGGRVDRAYLRDAFLDALSPPNYELSEQHNVTDWGASGASYDLLLTIAGGAGGQLLGTAIQTFLGRIKQRGNDIPIKEEDATQVARKRLCRRYEVAYNDLSVVSVDNDFESNRVTVTLRGPDGTEYVVEVCRHNERVTIARIYHGPGGV